MSSLRDPRSEPLTRTQRRVEELRAQLIDIAEALLVEGGVAAVTADEVARRADVSLQTVYNRVGRKPDLLLAIAERAMQANRRYVDAAYDGGGTLEERALRIFGAYTRFAFEQPQQFRILANPPGEPEALARIAAMAREQNGKLAKLIRDGMDAGLLDTRLSPEACANALWGMMDGLLLLALRDDGLRPPSVTPGELLANAMVLIETGLMGRRPQG
jgi:AcrR family transcriptional regulator